MANLAVSEHSTLFHQAVKKSIAVIYNVHLQEVSCFLNRQSLSTASSRPYHSSFSYLVAKGILFICNLVWNFTRVFGGDIPCWHSAVGFRRHKLQRRSWPEECNQIGLGVQEPHAECMHTRNFGLWGANDGLLANSSICSAHGHRAGQTEYYTPFRMKLSLHGHVSQ